MKAFVSAQAGVAVLIDKGTMRSITLDDDTLVQRQESDLPVLFAGASDLRQVDCRSANELSMELESAWAKDRALHLVIIVLDQTEERDLRIDAAECLEELITKPGVRDFIANRLYSVPLPAAVEVDDAPTLAEMKDCRHLLQFFRSLIEQQPQIRSRAKVWAELAPSLFSQEQERETFEAAAVEAGAFRAFVEEPRVDVALFQMLVHPLFRGNARARDVLQAWAAPFKEEINNVVFKEETTSIRVDARDQASRDVPSRYEVFRQVEKQREAIKSLLKKGNRELALRFTRELVAFQRISGEQEHLAKSLCDLAAFAKRLGDTSLQLAFAKWAVREAPQDAWSRGQAGDAFRGVGNFRDAMDAFEKAEQLGFGRVALLGRAEVLKELGQREESLSVYDECVNAYPSDNVARNGRAAALASFGRFEDSLRLYDELCGEYPIDPISWTGRAEVLKDMGRLGEALEQLDEVLEMFPDLEVPHCARGEVLREMGRLHDALDWFKQAVAQFPLSIYARNGMARVYKELGMFDEAISVFKQTTIEFPESIYAHVGIADVERRRGAVHKALNVYSEVRHRFPVSGFTRNGLAAVLSALGRNAEAESMLPDTPPATRSEWMARHIRGMIRLRSGDLAGAYRIFERGLQEVPWPVERSYFRAALASVEVRYDRCARALELLAEPVAVPIEAPAALIKMHAYGELGDTEGIEAATRESMGSENPIVTELRQQLVARYIDEGSEGAGRSQESLFGMECDLLLLAA